MTEKPGKVDSEDISFIEETQVIRDIHASWTLTGPVKAAAQNEDRHYMNIIGSHSLRLLRTPRI
jgi:hypothetical protein